MNDDQKCKKKMIFGKKHAALPQLQIPNHKQRVFYSVWHGHEQLTALETTKRKELHRHILTGCPWNHFGCQSLKERFFRDTLYIRLCSFHFFRHHLTTFTFIRLPTLGLDPALTLVLRHIQCILYMYKNLYIYNNFCTIAKHCIFWNSEYYTILLLYFV